MDNNLNKNQNSFANNNKEYVSDYPEVFFTKNFTNNTNNEPNGINKNQNSNYQNNSNIDNNQSNNYSPFQSFGNISNMIKNFLPMILNKNSSNFSDILIKTNPKFGQIFSLMNLLKKDKNTANAKKNDKNVKIFSKNDENNFNLIDISNLDEA